MGDTLALQYGGSTPHNKLTPFLAALSKTFKSPVVDTIQSLPQHKQIIACSAAKAFRGSQKDRTITELNKLYLEICKSWMITPAGITEFTNMCIVLNNQVVSAFSSVMGCLLSDSTTRLFGNTSLSQLL